MPSRCRLRYVILCCVLLAAAPVVVLNTNRKQGSNADVEREISHLRNRLRENPKDAFLHEQLAVLYMGRRDDRAALSEIRRAIELEPSDAFYHYRLGSIHEQSGNDTEALRSYTSAAQLACRSAERKEWSPIYAFNVGKMYQKSQRYCDAERWYERALSEYWAYLPEWRMTGMDRRSEKGDLGSDFERATRSRLSAVKEVLMKTRPTLDWVKGQLPMLRFPAQGAHVAMSASAQEAELAVLQGASGPGLHQPLGVEYYNVGRTEDAIVHLLAAAMLDDKSEVTWDQLGWAYLVQGRLAEAANAFELAARHGSLGSRQLAKDVKSAASKWRCGSRT